MKQFHRLAALSKHWLGKCWKVFVDIALMQWNSRDCYRLQMSFDWCVAVTGGCVIVKDHIYRMVIVEGHCTKLQLLISYMYNHWLTKKYSEFWLVRYNAWYCCYFLLYMIIGFLTTTCKKGGWWKTIIHEHLWEVADWNFFGHWYCSMSTSNYNFHLLHCFVLADNRGKVLYCEQHGFFDVRNFLLLRFVVFIWHYKPFRGIFYNQSFPNTKSSLWSFLFSGFF